MYRQPIIDPARHYFTDPEKARQFREQLVNIQRLIHYNNRRLAAGLPLVSYPPALVEFPDRRKPVIDSRA